MLDNKVQKLLMIPQILSSTFETVMLVKNIEKLYLTLYGLLWRGGHADAFHLPLATRVAVDGSNVAASSYNNAVRLSNVLLLEIVTHIVASICPRAGQGRRHAGTTGKGVSHQPVCSRNYRKKKKNS